MPQQPSIATLVFPIRHRKVLLSLGTKGVSLNRRNGYGGKVEPVDRSIIERAVTELAEEVELITAEKALTYLGFVTFVHPTKIVGLGIPGAKAVTVHMFVTRAWQGTPATTLTMKDPLWFPFDALPFTAMHPGTQLWLPPLLEGRLIAGTILYNDDATEVTDHQIHFIR